MLNTAIEPPLVSVLTTVYNRALYLTETLDSVISSYYTNWELIIIDDHSTDESLQIARDYQNKDKRIRVYANDKNLGDYPNRNQVASYAKGKYLKYLDADDIIYPYSLYIMVEAMEKYSDAGLGLSYNVIDDIKAYPIYVRPKEAYRDYFLGGGIFGTGPSASIIRKDCFDNLQGFKPIRHDGDTELWLRTARYYPVLKLQPALVWWRRHEEQEHNKRRSNLTWYTIEQEALLHKECPLSEVERIHAIKFSEYRCARTILRVAIKHKNPLRALTMFKESNLTSQSLILAMKRKNFDTESRH